jgi:hypothetical protein
MRSAVTIVAALMILGVAALGLILAQRASTPKGNIPTATVASTVYIASATQEISAPTRAPSTQIAQATGSEASPLILQANVDAQSDNPITTVTRAPPRRGSLPAAPARIWNLRWVHAFLAGRAQPCINVANNMLDHLSLTGDEVPSRQRTKHPRARQAPSNLVAADLRVRQPGVNQLIYENTASGPSTNLWTVRAR